MGELEELLSRGLKEGYAGGTIKIEQLAELGLTKRDVTGYLKKKIRELGERTRLMENCTPDMDGDWQYAYTILKTMEDIPLTISLETITFKGYQVFAHAFLHTPVE